MYAYLKGSDRSSAAALPLIVSVFTAAFTSAGISFDMDIDKYKRELTPNFYGYIPDETKAKARIFALLFMISATQLFTKAFACALCVLSSTWLLVGFIVGEFALFLLYKLAWSDFWYWVPAYGLVAVPMTLYIRICQKDVSDFTLLLQLRHP